MTENQAPYNTRPRTYYDDFPTRFISAYDLGGKEPILTIHAIDFELVRDETRTQQTCPIVYFDRAKKGLKLTKDKGRELVKMWGPVYQTWIGRNVQLYVRRTRVGEAVFMRPLDQVTNPPDERTE